MINKPQHIIISRTDSIGDVMLTLPICGWLKHHFPSTRITFIGRNYTRDIIRCCCHVDAFVNWDDISKGNEKEQAAALSQLGADTIIHVFPNKEVMKAAANAKIKHRVATGRRWFTLIYCNYPVFFSRKKSALHEAQLNCKLLKPLGIDLIPTLHKLDDLTGFTPPKQVFRFPLPEGKKIILHPLSKGSAVNWSLGQFEQLTDLLLEKGFHVCVTGTKEEGEKIKINSCLLEKNVIDLTGQLSLNELIECIATCDGLVAASTGPLHIASSLGLVSIGLFTPQRPMHPGRWQPIGKKAHVIVSLHHPENGSLDISAKTVLDLIVHSIPQ